MGALPYHDLLKWAGLASLALLPAAVAPVAMTPAGLPLRRSDHLRRDEDRMAVAIAGMVEKAAGGFRAPPAR